MNRGFRLAVAALVIGGSTPLLAPAQIGGGSNLLGKEPPPIQAAENAWLNWKGEISLADLEGHVVWLEFGFVM